MDEGEDALDGAMRELEEETGFVSASWESLGSANLAPSRNQSKAYYFLARSAKPEGERHLDDSEDIRVHTVPLGEMFSPIADGRITNAHSILGIHLASRRLGL